MVLAAITERTRCTSTAANVTKRVDVEVSGGGGGGGGQLDT